MTREEAINELAEMFDYIDGNIEIRRKQYEALNAAIKALKQIEAVESIIDVSNTRIQEMELNHLIDKIGDETDDKDKLKLLKEKLDQLEKDVNRLEKSRTIEVRPVYPNAPLTGISAYAGPEFNGICTGLPTNSSTTFLWGENDDKERSN